MIGRSNGPSSRKSGFPGTMDMAAQREVESERHSQYHSTLSSRRRIDVDELVKNFEARIATAKSEPKGVKAGPELWKAVKSAGLIQMRSVAAWGMTLDLPCPSIRTRAWFT